MVMKSRGFVVCRTKLGGVERVSLPIVKSPV